MKILQELELLKIAIVDINEWEHFTDTVEDAIAFIEAADHYAKSSINYNKANIDQHHLEYYRDKYPERYEILNRLK